MLNNNKEKFPIIKENNNSIRLKVTENCQLTCIFCHSEGKIKTGLFGAMMSVKIINDGPVTVMVESKKLMEKL